MALGAPTAGWMGLEKETQLVDDRDVRRVGHHED
jgi:hypothetical protein